MPRIRTIKPEFWISEDIAQLSSDAALLAIGLLNFCDDEGYFRGLPAVIKSQVFPLRNDIDLNTLSGLLNELVGINYICFMECKDGRSYGHICKFKDHQKVSKFTASKIKPNLKKECVSQNTTTSPLPDKGNTTTSPLPDKGNTTTSPLPDKGGSSKGELPMGKEGKGKDQGKEWIKEGSGDTTSEQTDIITNHQPPQAKEVNQVDIFKRSIDNSASTIGGQVVPIQGDQLARPSQDQGELLSPNWSPNEVARARLYQKGIPEEYINEKADSFMIHHTTRAAPLKCSIDKWSDKFFSWANKDWCGDAGKWKSSEQLKAAGNQATATATLNQMMSNDW